MSNIIESDIDSKWEENALLKLSCKELKKMARQSNINANAKKAELVKSLVNLGSLSKPQPVLEIATYQNDNHDQRRLTRSKTSIFRPEGCNLYSTLDKSLNLEAKSNLNNPVSDDMSQSMIEISRGKKRGRRVLTNQNEKQTTPATLDMFTMVSSIQVNKPLSDIDNSKKLKISEIEEDLKNIKVESVEGSEKSKKRRRKKGKLDKENNHQESAELINEGDGDEAKSTPGALKRQKTFTKLDEGESVKTEKVKSPRSLTRQSTFTNDDSGESVKTEKVKTPKSLTRHSTFTNDDSGDADEAKSTPTAKSTTFTKLDEGESVKTEKVKSPRNLTRHSTFTNDDSGESVKTEKVKSPRSLTRQSTFTNDDSGESMNPEDVKSPPTLTRQTTFTKDDADKSLKSEQAKSPPTLSRQSTFTKDDTGEVKEQGNKTEVAKSTPVVSKRRSTSIKNNTDLSVKKTIVKHKTPGLSVKKTIVKHKTPGPSEKKLTLIKNLATPGSEYTNKVGVARKIPDFKKAHQRLFNDMESAVDNEKRVMERAQIMLGSPAPRCAFVTSTKKENKNENPEIKTKTATPANRFGFKSRTVKKEEATNMIKTKAPPVSSEKIKDGTRTTIKGVRTNKRFDLLMKMREKNN